MTVFNEMCPNQTIYTVPGSVTAFPSRCNSSTNCSRHRLGCAQSFTKRMFLGCVNLPPQPEGESRNLGTPFQWGSVNSSIRFSFSNRSRPDSRQRFPHLIWKLHLYISLAMATSIYFIVKTSHFYHIILCTS